MRESRVTNPPRLNDASNLKLLRGKRQLPPACATPRLNMKNATATLMLLQVRAGEMRRPAAPVPVAQVDRATAS